MTNRFTRGVGRRQDFNASGRHGGALPSMPLYDGYAEKQAAATFAGIGKQLGKMADKAAIREGEAAGRLAGLTAKIPSSATPHEAFMFRSAGDAPSEEQKSWSENLISSLMGSSAVSSGGVARAALKLGVPLARGAAGDLTVVSDGAQAIVGLVKSISGQKLQVQTPSGLKFSAAVNGAIEAAAKNHGVSSRALAVIAQLESGGDPSARNPKSSAAGLFQFIDDTARAYGLRDKLDPVAAADAGARLLLDNSRALQQALGRSPTVGELYLAHQQGAGGAIALLSNPDASASEIVGRKAVTLNGGNAGMKAKAFAALWTNKADRIAAKLGGGEARDFKLSDVLAFRSPPTAPGVEQSVQLPAPGSALSSIALSERGIPEGEGDPLQLKRNGTLRGDAFDQAAMASFGWRMEAQLSEAIDAAFDAHQDDPGAFAQELDRIYGEYAAGDSLQDPEIQEVFAKRFTKLSGVAQRNVMARARARQSAELTDAALEATEAGVSHLERQGYTLGIDEAGDEAFAEELTHQQKQIDYRERTGALTPSQARKARQQLTERAIGARIQGVMDSIPDHAGKKLFAEQIMDDWSSGEGPISELDFQAAQDLSRRMLRQAETLSAEERSALAVEKATLAARLDDDLVSISTTGSGLEDLDPDDVAKLIGPDKALVWIQEREKAKELYAVSAGMKTATAEEIQQTIQDYRPEPGEPGYAEALEFHSELMDRAFQILEQREKDPANAADQAFSDLGELKAETDFNDLTSIAELGRQRLMRQEIMGIAPDRRQPLTDQEAGSIQQILIANPDSAQDYVREMRIAFGDQSDAVFAQIGKSDLGLGIALEISSKSQDGGALRVMLREKGLIAAKEVDALPRNAGKTEPLKNEVYGAAFQHLPGVAHGMQSNAWLIFSGRLRERGLSLDLDDPDQQGLYQQALREAAGETNQNGRVYGGFIDDGGLPVLVPAGTAQDEFETTLDVVREMPIEEFGNVLNATGVSFKRRQMQKAKFVAVSPDSYRISLGDPTGDDKRYLSNDNGEPLVFSFEQLQTLANRRRASIGSGAVQRRRARIGDRGTQ